MDPGEAHQLLQRVLAGIARHPNISGYVMIGLGCELNQIETIRRAQRLDELHSGELAPVFLNIQTAGGVRKTFGALLWGRWRYGWRGRVALRRHPSVLMRAAYPG